jgi:hypothetical protein
MMRRLWRRYRQGRSAKASLLALLDLHRPQWDNCINACCSGEKCVHRSQVCAHDYDPWPCETVLIIGKHVAEAHLT